MGWTSLLPDHLSVYEVWAVRIFLFLGLATIGPWVLLVLYDIVLYIFRSISYEMPYVGGKAKGHPRPRGISLSERADGHKRSISFGHSQSPSRHAPAVSNSTGLHVAESGREQTLRPRDIR